jgi:type IV pilus assembly protein PilM
MLNSKSFLALDLGAATLKLAEFEPNEAGGLRLKQYGVKPLGPEGFQESTRSAAVVRGLQELLAEHSYTSRLVNVCAPGFHVFSKFVKLPPVDSSKVTQIIQYEAQQNVPFPLEQVVWDYQILGTTPTGELEVLLVAIKSDIVEGLFKAVESVGLKMQLADVSPAALCNAFRYNYSDLQGCTLLLDIGAKTSNLLFFEGENVYSRGINIGANAITVDFAKESKLGFDEAERLKISDGFVGLTGAYEDPENPNQAAISKIARQVMTRLHIQVNQTIQFYRGQQGGSPPERLFLSGGAAMMPYTAQFFTEKLNLPVDYFNPFRNLQIDPALNVEELAKVGHSFGEVVGVSLRNLAHCPVELNLMPHSSLQRQQFNARKPYLAVAAACLVLIVWFFALFYHRMAIGRRAALERIEPTVNELQDLHKRLQDATNRMLGSVYAANLYGGWLDARTYWANLFGELRHVLLTVEDEGRQAFGVKTGMWIEWFEPVVPGEENRFVSKPTGTTPGGGRTPGSVRPGGGGVRPGGGGVRPGGGGVRPGTGRGLVVLQPKANTTNTVSTNAVEGFISQINVRCRMVDLNGIRATANSDFAYMFDKAISRSAYFVTNESKLGDLQPAGDGMTYTFNATLTLKRPIRL